MSVLKNFVRLFNLLQKKEKIQFLVLLAIVLFGTVVETLGVGAILPFMVVILNPQIIEESQILNRIYQIPLIGNHNRFVIFMCIALMIIYIVKNLYVFFQTFIQCKYVLKLQQKLSLKLFYIYIRKSYEFFFNKNSADLHRNISSISSVMSGGLISTLLLISEVSIASVLLFLLLLTDFLSAMIILVLLGFMAGWFYFSVRRTLDRAGNDIALAGSAMAKAIYEGFGSIKEIKVLRREQFFLDTYEFHSRLNAKAQFFYNLLNALPRLLIETAIVSCLAIIVLVNIVKGNPLETILPTLALFGAAGIRIMPSINRSLNHLMNIRYYSVFIDYFYEDLHSGSKNELGEGVISSSPPSKELKQVLRNQIEIKNLSYRYPNTDPYVLENADLIIKKGTTVGFSGPSGAGKTTLVDLILGILKPTGGSIVCDGIDIWEMMDLWQGNIGYIPQQIFIIDDTIRRNVAFGLSDQEIEDEKVWNALEAAQMKEFIQSLPEGIATRLGERGHRLSGGQRQRVGIARALYHNPEVLIMDEATSSLDSQTEKMITETIHTLSAHKTLIIIAHRLNTLVNCDEIFEVNNGKVKLTRKEEILKEILQK